MVNLLQAGGYLMIAPFFRLGDWNAFLHGLRPQIGWKLALTALGLAISIATLHFGRRELAPFCGADNPLRSQQAWLLTALPYVVGGLLSCAIALLNPIGKMLIVTSAGAATFGGTSGLLWIGYTIGVVAVPASGKPPIIESSPTLIVLALVALAVWAIVLGPGITLRAHARG